VNRPGFPDLDWLPRPPELERDPELAVLAVLHVALNATIYALVAAHPHLASDWPRPPYPEVAAADRVLSAAAVLLRAIAKYRRVLDDLATVAPPAGPGDDDIPF
jgi:hypothetical protein